MNQLETGDKFAFVQEATKAVHLKSPFGGRSLGYHLPAKKVHEIYKPELLGDSININKDDVLEVVRAYQSVSGWWIVAARNGYEVQFLEKDVEVQKIN